MNENDLVESEKERIKKNQLKDMKEVSESINYRTKKKILIGATVQQKKKKKTQKHELEGCKL
jgi:hypothetical protein